MSQQKVAILTTTVTAAGALSAYQAVGYDNDVAAAQEPAVRGFATTDAESGDQVAIDRMGTTIAIASGAVSEGEDLEVGASGALRSLTVGGVAVAIAEQDAADGERFEVFILPRPNNAPVQA